MLCDKFGLELFRILKQKSKAEQTQDRTRAEPGSAPYFQPTPFCVGTIGFQLAHPWMIMARHRRFPFMWKLILFKKKTKSIRHQQYYLLPFLKIKSRTNLKKKKKLPFQCMVSVLTIRAGNGKFTLWSKIGQLRALKMGP